ncbi:hypothetical protein RN001_009076 [Aquatica leii]|uniref:Uncharacterized protein n=1 Tax=Aquatica leii TaxID=1421715 RepID=A0AAN7SPR2_9COLE|nr:hypothetical protein RN001_009076 [Aquatica leii]
MEEDSKRNQKLFYRVLKTLRKRKQQSLRQIKSKDNKILTDEKEIMERWKEYFQELLNTSKTGNTANEEKEKHLEDKKSNKKHKNRKSIRT